MKDAVQEEIKFRTPELKSTLSDAAQTVTQQVKASAGRVKEEAKQAAKQSSAGRDPAREPSLIGRLLRRRSFLSDREQDLRAREQELLDRLARALEAFGPDVVPEDLQRYQEARDQLAGLSCWWWPVEFELRQVQLHQRTAGRARAARGRHPHHRPDQPAAARQHRRRAAAAGLLLERTHPAELLRELEVVDTPAPTPSSGGAELTRNFVPRADLVLFVTSADRPFTESERGFLEQIRQWGKKIVFVVNKIDILSPPPSATR